MTSEYQRILYPERAEYFQDEQAFDSYRIFLDHWSEITTYLQEAYEIHRTRSHSKSLIVYGAQGIGKSILAAKIYKDFEKTKDDLKKGSLLIEKENIWHRISSGRAGGPQVDNISASAGKTVIVKFESQKNWVEEAAKITAANKDRSCLVIVDNCERDFFLKGLLNVSDDTYLTHGRSEVAMRQSAHRFVELCRNELRGCLFLFFTNDEHFALTFDVYINAQHSGLSDIRDLKMPADSAKEVIVRINVNRLNSFSYWKCIDRAGPTEKAAVWNALKGATTFPDTFKAVDNALRSADTVRIGRPARKNVVTAFVLTGSVTAPMNNLPQAEDTDDIFLGTNMCSKLYKSKWGLLLNKSDREYQFLSSEWALKVVLVSDAFVSLLLEGDSKAKEAIDLLTTYHGPGTHATTKTAHTTMLESLDSHISDRHPSPDNSTFWSKGSVRNHDYEGQLKNFYPTYNTANSGLLNARPDLVLSAFSPCSVLGSPDSDADHLNSSIRREANTVEFTAIKDFNFAKLTQYLVDQKLQNYIKGTQEQ